MSYVRITYLYCDGPLCQDHQEAAYHGAGPSDSLSDQRKLARGAGWHIAQPGGKDYCEECWEHLNSKEK